MNMNGPNTDVSSSAALRNQAYEEARCAASYVVEEPPDDFAIAHEVGAFRHACEHIVRCRDLLQSLPPDELNTDMAVETKKLLSAVAACAFKVIAFGDVTIGLSSTLTADDPERTPIDIEVLKTIEFLGDADETTFAGLGYSYAYTHSSVSPDYRLAAQYFQATLDRSPNNNMKIREELGSLYCGRQGFDGDLAKAIELLTGPALGGSVNALRVLGVAYFYEGPTRDLDKSHIALSAAANMGDGQAASIIAQAGARPLSNPNIALLGPDTYGGGRSNVSQQRGNVVQNAGTSGGAETSGQGGCYVATAVYGSYDCPEVWVLRRYRDQELIRHAPGRVFVHTYYAVSPHIVRAVGDKPWFNRFFRRHLDRFVGRLRGKGYSDARYDD